MKFTFFFLRKLFKKYKTKMVKNHKEFDYNNQTRMVKDRNDGARISNWNNKDTLISNCFEEKTLYEFFLRGQRVSSKFF